MVKVTCCVYVLQSHFLVRKWLNLHLLLVGLEKVAELEEGGALKGPHSYVDGQRQGWGRDGLRSFE